MATAASKQAMKCFILALGMLFADPALAQGASASSPVELAHRAEALQPGQWVTVFNGSE